MNDGDIKNNNSVGIEFHTTTTSNLSGWSISNNYYIGLSGKLKTQQTINLFNDSTPGIGYVTVAKGYDYTLTQDDLYKFILHIYILNNNAGYKLNLDEEKNSIILVDTNAEVGLSSGNLERGNYYLSDHILIDFLGN